MDNEEYTVVIVDVGLHQFAEKLRDNGVLLLLVCSGLLHTKLWEQLAEKTKQLNIAVGNLERVQAEILRALI